MMPEKFNNKTNGITQRRFLAHGNPLLADWVTDKIGPDWITDLSQLSKLKVYADDEKALQEFMTHPSSRKRMYTIIFVPFTTARASMITQDHGSLTAASRDRISINPLRW